MPDLEDINHIQEHITSHSKKLYLSFMIMEDPLWGINSIFIVLIPKKKGPGDVKNF